MQQRILCSIYQLFWVTHQQISFIKENVNNKVLFRLQKQVCTKILFVKLMVVRTNLTLLNKNMALKLLQHVPSLDTVIFSENFYVLTKFRCYIYIYKCHIYLEYITVSLLNLCSWNCRQFEFDKFLVTVFFHSLNSNFVQ